MVDTISTSSTSPTVEHPWRALTVTLLVGFMSLLDVTIVDVAVPSTSRGWARHRRRCSGWCPATR